MKTGKYWGSAEHRKIIAEEKKETLDHIKYFTERYLITQDERTKAIIDHWYEWYKQLRDYKF